MKLIDLFENDTHEYQVIDTHTKEPVGKPHKNRLSASRKANKKDLEYGAIRYTVKPVKKADSN